MSYFLVENFAAGVDTRKHPLAAPAGTLRDAVNVHVSPGGEIEKRKSFVKTFFDEDPDGNKIRIDTTFGLATLNNDLYVFQDATVTNGTGVDGWSSTIETLTTPFGDITIQRQLLTGSEFSLATPGATPLDTLLDWDVYDGKLYIVAQDSAGSVQHFFDGARVTDVNAKGSRIRVFKQKVYGIADDGIYFSTATDPTDWTTTANGAGFINTSEQARDGDEPVGVEIYYDKLAVFFRRGVQVWSMDADPNNNALAQVINGTGLVGGATPRQYGSGDVIFLSASGIRSLLARDSSNAGAVSDVGSPIDTEIRSLLQEDFANLSMSARTLIEENTGRLWVTFGDKIWVLSQFPGPGVTAWTCYGAETVAGTFSIVDLCEARGTPCLRGDDNVIYVFGGSTGEVYDIVEASVTLPFLTAERPADIKQFRGLDATALGVWDVDVNPISAKENWVHVASISGSTFLQGRIGAAAYSNAVSTRFRTKSAERAVLAQVILHYDLAEAS